MGDEVKVVYPEPVHSSLHQLPVFLESVSATADQNLENEDQEDEVMSHNQQASEYLAEQNTPSPEKTEELPVLHAEAENGVVDRGLFNIDLQTGYPMIYHHHHQ